MKSKLTILFLFSIVLGFSQSIDTFCVKTRWVAVGNNDSNKGIFYESNEEANIVEDLKMWIESDQIKMYEAGPGPNNKNDWYALSQNKISQKPDSNSPFFFWLASDSPLTNIYGEDRTVVSPDGIKLVVYPPRKRVEYSTKDIVELRIREELDNPNNFSVTGLSICFYSANGLDIQEKFWIDVNELLAILNKEDRPNWLKEIINQNYIGFVYMRVPCYDGIVRN